MRLSLGAQMMLLIAVSACWCALFDDGIAAASTPATPTQFALLLRRAAQSTESPRRLERRTPQQLESCVSCRGKVAEPCPQCGSDEVCTLVKRTCESCEKHVCTPLAMIAKASTVNDASANHAATQKTPWIVTGICAGAVVAVALGLFAVWKRRQSKRILVGETSLEKDEEDEEDDEFGGKNSIELEHGDQFLFPPPAVAWRSSQTSSLSWDEDAAVGGSSKNALGLRVDTGHGRRSDSMARKDSFRLANEATETLATMAAHSGPRAASPLLPEPCVPAGDRMMLPQVEEGVSRFSMASSSYDFNRFNGGSQQDAVSTNAQKSPTFPCPDMPPPRAPTNTSSMSWRDSNVDSFGMASQRSSTTESIRSIAQVNVAQVKPMRARETLIRRSLLGGVSGDRDTLYQRSPVKMGSFAEVQEWKQRRQTRGSMYQSQDYSYAPPQFGGLNRHSSTSSLGNSADLQRYMRQQRSSAGEEPMAPAKLKRNSSLSSYRPSVYGGQ